MNLFRLVRRNLLDHPVRSALTVGAITVAIFLFCFVRSIVTSLDAAVHAAKTNRIIVASAVSLFQSLPTPYLQKIRSVDGVEESCNFTWFGGRYKDDPKQLIAQFGTDPKELLDIYPEVVLPKAARQAWFEDRQGAIVGIGLAEKFNWKVGDKIPLIGTIYPKVDGSAWTFNIHGIYRSRSALVDEQTMFFHWDYMDEVLERGDAFGPRGSSVYVVRIKDGFDPGEVSAQIDDFYDGGPQRTRTQAEAAFQASFVGMFGNLPVFLGTIAGAVLIAILFGVVNTMTIAARGRTRSMGIIKSLGFSSGIPARLYLMESCLLALVGGGAGIGIALLSQLPIRRFLGTQIPMYEVAGATIVTAVGMCVVIGLLGGLVPAWQAARLGAAESLRRGG